MFCPKCGSILVPKMSEGKAVLKCSCGYTNSDTGAGRIKETVKKTAEVEFEAAESKSNLPLTETDCPKCHNSEAHYWTRQTRAADEAETKFFQCAKCKHRWREY